MVSEYLTISSPIAVKSELKIVICPKLRRDDIVKREARIVADVFMGWELVLDSNVAVKWFT
jgi:hypothetical protein